jgi:tRNA-dihydrouridine synthase B
MTLAGIPLTSNLFLAPMAGYTDSPFRRICRGTGAGFTFSELISAEALVRRHKKTLAMIRFAPAERPYAIQIFGRTAAMISHAAQVAEEYSPDSIDINMGCSVAKVMSGGAGAGLLRDPNLVYDVVNDTVKSVKLPVSAKIRLGQTEKTRNYRDVVNAIQDAGGAWVTVHGRTSSQKYSGRADWDTIAEIASFAKIPVIGNGDIRSHADALEKIKRSGVFGAMIGRASVGNPWIFDSYVPSHIEVINMAIDHLTMMLDYYGDHGLVISRKLIVRYLHGFRNASHLRGMVVHSTSSAWVLDLLESMKGMDLESEPPSDKL